MNIQKYMYRSSCKYLLAYLSTIYRKFRRRHHYRRVKKGGSRAEISQPPLNGEGFLIPCAAEVGSLLIEVEGPFIEV